MADSFPDSLPGSLLTNDSLCGLSPCAPFPDTVLPITGPLTHLFRWMALKGFSGKAGGQKGVVGAQRTSSAHQAPALLSESWGTGSACLPQSGRLSLRLPGPVGLTGQKKGTEGADAQKKTKRIGGQGLTRKKLRGEGCGEVWVQ